MAEKEWRRRVARFTAARREHYLEVLGLTGNRTAAAEAIGFRTNRIAGMRKRDAAFDAACEEALEAATARLADAEGPFEGVEDGDFQTIRIGRNGRAQIIAVGPGRWSARVEDRFIGLLGQCGNVEASARAVGFAGTDMFRRRRQWPAFARRWEEALEEAEVRLEFRLACAGSKFTADEDESLDSGVRGNDEGGVEIVPFDPEFALKFLKWREEKRAGRGRRGRRDYGPREPSIEEVKASILRKIEAIEAHDRRFGTGAD